MDVTTVKLGAGISQEAICGKPESGKDTVTFGDSKRKIFFMALDSLACYHLKGCQNKGHEAGIVIGSKLTEKDIEACQDIVKTFITILEDDSSYEGIEEDTSDDAMAVIDKLKPFIRQDPNGFRRCHDYLDGHFDGFYKGKYDFCPSDPQYSDQSESSSENDSETDPNDLQRELQSGSSENSLTGKPSIDQEHHGSSERKRKTEVAPEEEPPIKQSVEN